MLELLTELRRELRSSMLFISHDLGVVASISDRVLVLDRGVVCEQGPVRTLLQNPADPYTQRLIAAAPRLDERARRMSPSPPGRLEGKRAVITGGGSGIGAASAVRFAKEGAAVAIIDIDAPALDGVATAISAAGGRVVVHTADVSDEAQIAGAIDSAGRRIRWSGHRGCQRRDRADAGGQPCGSTRRRGVAACG